MDQKAEQWVHGRYFHWLCHTLLKVNSNPTDQAFQSSLWSNVERKESIGLVIATK